MSDQDRLDAATEKLMKAMRLIDAAADGLALIEAEADKEAGKRCKQGDNDTSADLREIAGMIQSGRGRIVDGVGVVKQAYAKGRRLSVPDGGGGVIVPFGGGS
jgi:hypothetical protein